MNGTTATLRRLRTLFVVYFLARTSVGIALTWPAFGLAVNDIEGRSASHGQVPLAPVMAFGRLLEVGLFALGFWILTQLLHRKNWARVLLLIVGWLAVLGALFALSTNSQIASLGRSFGHIVPGLDWQRIAQVGVIQDALALIFWGYLVYVLQIDDRVKGEFLGPLAPPA